MTKRADIADDAAAGALSVFRLLLQDYHPRDFTICFWDGTQWPAETNSPRFNLIIKHPHALRSMLRNTTTDLSLSEAYIRGYLDVEGDFEAAMPVGYHLLGRHWPALTMLRLGWHLFRLPAAPRYLRNGREPARLRCDLHSVQRDRQAVPYHYNVSNSFYALWLDQRMVYSCAYFETADEDLDTAQERKLDYICRKLRLRPGERLLDIGCGWGGLVMHAAQRYGVLAHGITLSAAQLEEAKARIAAAGLQDRITVEQRDYRELE